MSISTPLPQIEPAPLASPPLRRPKRKRRTLGPRGFIAAGMVLLVVLVGVGAFLAYENTLPTTVASNVKNGAKDVPADSAFDLKFSRGVSIEAVNAAFSITPATDGTLTEVSGQSEYAWLPTKPLRELTTYTVTLKPTTDTTHHHVNGGQWSFTTLIVPRVLSITSADGTTLKDGMEIDPGTAMKLTFNDQMEPATIKVTIGGQVATLKWAADDKSATFSTTGLPSGPIVVQMAPGGRDQTGHAVAAAFALKTGVYWHDHEHTVALSYPALIQIPNDEFARDQNGLQAADIVFEYLAEGGITRLTAIFEHAPDVIGPMRSARYISLKLGRHYRGLLFQSGESQLTRARAAQDPTPQFFDTIGYQYRTASRDAPDNLMINGDRVQAAEGLYGISSYTIPKAHPIGLTGGGVGTSFNVDEHYSYYEYQAATGTYTKSEESHLYRDASLNAPLHIEMVIQLHTSEQLLAGDGHGSFIHDYDLDSSGGIDVYYKGQHYLGTWTSTDGHGPLTFTIGSGQTLTLPPGLVWIDVTQ